MKLVDECLAKLSKELLLRWQYAQFSLCHFPSPLRNAAAVWLCRQHEAGRPWSMTCTVCGGLNREIV